MTDNLRLIDDHLGLYTLLAPVAPGTALPVSPADGDGQIYTDGTYAVFNTGTWISYPARSGIRACLVDGTNEWRCSGTEWVSASDLLALSLALPSGTSEIGGTWFGGVIATIAALATSAGAGMIGFIAAGVGAVLRSILAKLRDIVSAPDFGTLGDGLTDDTVAIGKAEAATASSILLPEGVYPLADATPTQKDYYGPGVFSFGGIEIPTARKARVHEVIQNASTVLGDLAQFYLSIQARASSVVFCGDSITEGLFQTAYEDSWGALFSNELRTRLPGVAWDIQNLSLAGLGIATAQSVSFIGGATNDFATVFNRPKGTDPAYATSNKDINIVTGNADVWPGGSTDGKTWRDHLKDATPDLLIIAHGQNDVDGNSAAWATYCKVLINYARTWAKPPSIVIVTACPATRKQAAWRGYGPNIQVSADAARAVAMEMNCTLIDANRQYLMLRDGIDYVRKSSQSLSLIVGYPTNWTGMATMPTLAAATLTWASAGKIYNSDSAHNAQDLHFTGQFAPAVTGQVCGLIYRGTYEAQVDGAFLRLYYGASLLAAIGITEWVGGATHELEVVCNGGRHQAFVDGVKLIDLYDYSNMTSAGIGVEMNGAGTVALLSMIRGIPRTVGPAVLTEDELLGISSADYWTNPNTKGGDGIHHPSSAGNYSTYFAASLGLVAAAERAYSLSALAPGSKAMTPNGANNAISYTAPNIATSYLTADGFIQFAGSLTPNGATTIAAGTAAASLDVSHVPDREVDGVVYIAGTVAYCRVLPVSGNIIFGVAVTAGQLANMDGFRFKQNN